VLSVDQVYEIRRKVLVERVGIRRVAREFGVSRNTVRKYLSAAVPQRRLSRPRRRPVLEAVEPRLEALIEEWTPRTAGKQRLTAARLHEELRHEGFTVGRTLVQAILRERRRQAAEVYVPLVHRPGDEAQVDFFDVRVDVGAERRRAWLFVLRLMYSGRDFAWVYEWADQVSFLDGHVRAFAALGGVPHRCIYDNLTAAVRKLVLPERELTARFTALASHYLFEPCFTRRGEGHDKGGVEARGKGIRWQHLVPIPRGDTLAAINEALTHRLAAQAATRTDAQGRTVGDRFAAEAPALLPLRAPAFEPRKVVLCSVSTSAKVRVDGATYSVPTRWAQLEATALVGPTDVGLSCRGERVTHPRQAFGGTSICYRHYLPELARKPQAVRQVAAELLGELGEPFGRYWRLLVDAHGPREAARSLARVLGAVEAHGEAAVAAALTAALATQRTDLLALGALRPRSPAPPIMVPPALAAHTVPSPSARAYDALLGQEEER
jgi:transposase